MPHRRWRAVRTFDSEEIVSNVDELRSRMEERSFQLRARRVKSGTPTTMWISVVTQVPEGTPLQSGREARAARVAWARHGAEAGAARRKQRRPVHFQDAEPVPTPQVGERPLIRWRELIANRDADRRAQRIQRTKNELAYNYAWSENGGDFCEYILEEIQRHMLEPVGDGGRTWFDPFWTRDEVLDFLEMRVNRFLVQTGAWREQATLTAVEELTLPVMNELRRAIYIDGNGTTTPLEVGDLHAKDQSSVGWGGAVAGTPDTIILWGQGQRARLSPPPDGGTVLLDYVPRFEVRGEPWERGNYWTAKQLYSSWVGQVRRLPIPNIFYPYIKYGVMADMLSKEGEMQDSERAKYCEARFAEGVEIAKMWLGRRN